MLRKLESSREEAFSKGFELISVPLIFGHPKSWTFSVPLIFGHPQPKIKGSRKFMGIRYTKCAYNTLLTNLLAGRLNYQGLCVNLTYQK